MKAQVMGRQSDGPNGNEATPGIGDSRPTHGPETDSSGPTRLGSLLDPERTLKPVVVEPQYVDVDALLEADAASSRLERPARNGAYAGPLPVRYVAPGVSGEDVLNLRLEHLRPGKYWRRGASRVRIEKVGVGWVRFRDVSHGSGTLRKQVISSFVRGGYPEGLNL